MNELEVIQDVTLSLDILGIPYMLTGSIAMNYYATPRMTRDIDMVIELHNSKIELLENEFKGKYYIDSDLIKLAINSKKMFNIIHLESFIKVDMIIKKDSEFRLLEFERRKKVPFVHLEIYIVSKEDLILSKLAWARDSRSELQKRDILNLLSTGYDKEYLHSHIHRLELKEIFEDFTRE
jgi:hypothetical protein